MAGLAGQRPQRGDPAQQALQKVNLRVLTWVLTRVPIQALVSQLHRVRLQACHRRAGTSPPRARPCRLFANADDRQ